MSAANFKVSTGATNWQPNAAPRPMLDEGAVAGRSSVPPQPTRRHVPQALHREPTDGDKFVESGHFKFIADTLAAGELPTYRAMWTAGEVFGVEDVTTALMQASVRTALVAEVAKRSNGRVRLVEAKPEELGGAPIEGDAIHLAIERPGARIPFAIVPEGFEPHRRGR